MGLTTSLARSPITYVTGAALYLVSANPSLLPSANAQQGDWYHRDCYPGKSITKENAPQVIPACQEVIKRGARWPQSKVLHNLAGAHHNLSLAYYAMGERSLAILASEEAVKINPLGRHHMNLGILYLQEKRWQESLDTLTQGCILDPSGAQRLQGVLGDLYQGSIDGICGQKTTQALINWVGSREKNEEAGILLKARKLKESIEVFTESIALDPRNVNPYVGRGIARDGLGDLDNAIADYTKAIELRSNRALLYNFRGLVWRRKNNIVAEINDFSEAIKIDPKYKDALSNRADALQRIGQLGSALTDINSLIVLEPTSILFHAGRADLHERLGNTTEAIADYCAILKLDTMSKIPELGKKKLQEKIENLKGKCD